MKLSYKEYTELMDKIGEKPDLLSEDSPLHIVSKFSREHPDTYEQYRKRYKNIGTFTLDNGMGEGEALHKTFVNMKD